ncbi:helix-turn-helix domain-containing protein [Escherichia coli]|uniref:helix-turn-helix domain-containing protein n=1 Tax=Escherichia coli TaxID=562 RepID=UPI0019A5A20C|nr:helix-turn-helix domain-containing protein [Escherichia coli]MCM2845637.1 helix-turn-helix domain-containing protein [Escherichia coli]MDY8263413.1 helix-turn-helix domain-containing protein [Escherichia coli]MDY8349668.1 helix-turn-helix domain-containing protein [Escherichia coli]
MMQPDWHPADIIAGLAPVTLANALTRSWPRGEKLIADALETSPEIIWPSRYFDNQGNRTERIMRKRRS